MESWSFMNPGSGLLAAATQPGGLGDVDWLWLVLRLSHFIAGFTLVGGAMYLRWVLVPAAERHGASGQLAELMAHGRKRWAMIVGISALFLIGSGLFSFVRTIQLFELSRPWYHMIFGIKFLLSLVVFFLASVLAGRTQLAEKFRAKLSFWLSAIVWLSLAILLLATLLRFLPRTDKVKLAPAPATVAMSVIDASRGQRLIA